MGLLVTVLRRADGADCTAGGVSSQTPTLCVVNVPGPFSPSERAAAVLLAVNGLGNPILVPAVWSDTGADADWVPLRPAGYVGPMAGGNYAESSDDRFTKAVRELGGHPFYGALSVHDRFETPAEYRSLSS